MDQTLRPRPAPAGHCGQILVFSHWLPAATLDHWFARYSAIPECVHVKVFSPSRQIVRRRVGLAEQRKPRLEQFFDRLLHMKAENFIRENGSIRHAAKSGKVLLRRCQQ